MELHSLVSEKFPGHLPTPSTAGSLQDRALNSTPLPQETVHRDQGLHSCHSVTAPARTIDKWLNILPRGQRYPTDNCFISRTGWHDIELQGLVWFERWQNMDHLDNQQTSNLQTLWSSRDTFRCLRKPGRCTREL